MGGADACISLLHAGDSSEGPQSDAAEHHCSLLAEKSSKHLLVLVQGST